MEGSLGLVVVRDSWGRSLGLGFRDKAYAQDSSTLHSYKKPHKGLLSKRKKTENRHMATVREEVEHIFGKICKYFKFVRDESMMKLRGHKNVKLYFCVATILYNCRNCLYPDQTSTFFDCTPPTLEHYTSRRT